MKPGTKFTFPRLSHMKRLVALSIASLATALAQAPGTSPSVQAMVQTYCV